MNSTGRTFKEDELDAFVSLSPLTQGDTGRIDVLPAFGSASARQPENILPKIARAMTEQVDGEGEVVAMGPRLSSMIARFTARGSYDVVLIDSRAGLAELAAPAVLSLGALVLLFGTAQNQTITGFGALFAGLKLLATRSILMGGDADWRLMFKPVYAKASLDPVTAERYRADIYDLFAENLYDQVEDLSTEGDSFNFSIDDLDAPHEPLIIPFDSRFVDFDPAVTQSQLTRSFYEQTFRPFLDGLDKALDWMSEIANAPSDT
ncbi:MAG TPA: hypothetical protein VFE22_11865 [Edaphobacter sp.]|nr:hypothetical protein [Edaphobacter sp.]